MDVCPLDALKLFETVLTALCEIVRCWQRCRLRQDDIDLDNEMVALVVDAQMLDRRDEGREARDHVRHTLMLLWRGTATTKLDNILDERLEPFDDDVQAEQDAADRVEVLPAEQLADEREQQREKVEHDIVLGVLRECLHARRLDRPAPEPHDQLCKNRAQVSPFGQHADRASYRRTFEAMVMTTMIKPAVEMVASSASFRKRRCTDSAKTWMKDEIMKMEKTTTPIGSILLRPTGYS